jgi:hypothetical protein
MFGNHYREPAKLRKLTEGYICPVFRKAGSSTVYCGFYDNFTLAERKQVF